MLMSYWFNWKTDYIIGSIITHLRTPHLSYIVFGNGPFQLLLLFYHGLRYESEYAVSKGEACACFQRCQVLSVISGSPDDFGAAAGKRQGARLFIHVSPERGSDATPG